MAEARSLSSSCLFACFGRVLMPQIRHQYFQVEVKVYRRFQQMTFVILHSASRINLLWGGWGG